MPIKLELLTHDPEEKELAMRYWAMSEAGEFVEKVIDLLPFREITQSGLLAGRIREWCRALDENLTCLYCDTYMEVKSRSGAKKYPQKSVRPCPSCKVLEDERERQAQAAEAAELDAQLNAYIDQLPTHPFDYGQLSDDQAFLLLALDVAISPRLGNTAFTVGDCKALAPTDISLFIEKLKAARILREDPRQAAPDTYFLLNGQLVIRTRQIAYTLAPDQHLESSDGVLEMLLKREYSDSPALFNLWLDFASADAMCYLADKCRAFDHDLNEGQFNEIRSTLREGLKTYSVSQIWFVIWKNVKDAASLSKLVYYSNARATATIPGKIRRTLEKVVKEGSNVRMWHRPDYQPCGALGMLFNELFGIDEDTPGIEVLERLTELLSSEPEITQDMPQPEPVKRLLCDALLNDTGPQMLHRFATLIREGHEMGWAIEHLLDEDLWLET